MFRTRRERRMDTTRIFDVPVNYVLGRCSLGEFDDEDEPTTPTLSVLNVSYVVKEWVGPWWRGACFRPIRHKIVVRDVCLHAKAGQLTAILGNSGSGKTTLLDIISGRVSGRVTGKVYYNNIECTSDVMNQYTSYVMQADRLLPNLTVRETLTYSARLRLPGNLNTFDIEDKVNKVIIEMGLKHVADTRIGGTVRRGISGGERRRVTIAIQLLQNPKIILLDEPTSGLDSFTARYLISNLADLAHNGKIVILTIHQPRSDLFKMFDQVGILSGGQMVYFGASDYMLRYFSDQQYPCPQFANPLDYFVGLASIDRRNVACQEETTERVNKLVKNYAGSDTYKETVFKIIEDTMKPSTRRQLLTARFTTVRRNQPSFFRALFTLLSRMTVHILRDRPSYLSRLLLLSLFVPFICVFLGHLKQTQSSVQDRIGLMYQSSQVPPYVSVLNAVALFPPLRDLYYRECRDGLYSTFTFMIAYCMHTLPFTLISSSIFSSIVYWVTGLNPTTSGFLIYSAVVFFLNFWGEMVTIVIMAIFLNPAIANSTSALIASASGLMASGFLRNLQDMIPVFQWFAWGNIFKYAGEILVVNEFHNLELTCTQNDTTCLPNGNFYLDLFYPDAVDNMRRNFWAIGTMVIATILISMTAFRIKGIPNLH